MNSLHVSLVLIIAETCLSFGADVGYAQSSPDLMLNRVEISEAKIDDRDPNLIRLNVGDPSDGNFSLPATISRPVAEPVLVPRRTGDEKLFKYQLQSLTVSANGIPSADLIGEFDGDSLNKSLPVPEALANTVLNLRALATFGVVDANANDNVVVDASVQQLYPVRVTSSEIVTVVIDNTAPALAESVPVERFPGGGGYFYLKFKDSDLDPMSLSTASDFTFTHTVKTTDAGEKKVLVAPEGLPTFDSNSRLLKFDFANLNPGPYTLAIAADAIKDTVGNPMLALTAETAVKFTVPGGRQHGKQVEYPRHLAPGDNGDLLLNPGDRVDTRDVRLYYFRDAHRVAQIINRNVRSLNQTGYNAAQRVAQRARETAEENVDERRWQETLAVQAAQTTRATRSALDDARQQLADSKAEATSLEDRAFLIDDSIGQIKEANGLPVAPVEGVNDIKQFDQAIETKFEDLESVKGEIQTADAQNADPTVPNVPPEQMAMLYAKKKQLEDDLARLQNARPTVASLVLTRSQEARQLQRADAHVTAAQQAVTRLESKVIADEQQEIRFRNAVQTAEARELRAEQERFRREVAAGLADRDTYVAGQLTSIDPVTQVTITVVGEGTLQLRGPVNGINKICRMVHQIDSPVGQVKIGIHTIQINGEHGNRMERVYEDIEKHVAHSRFLTNQSMLLFRKAVSQVASEIATSIDQGYVPDDCQQVFMTECIGQNSRDLKYMYAFFGKDFIAELREMDSELLRSDNKLLSLHSMDTISLAGALQVAALANNTARQRIIQTFQMLIGSELAEKEVQYYRTLTRTPHRHEFLNKFMTQGMQIRRDQRDAERLMFNSHRTYNFANTVGFFDSQISGEGTLNNVQYATIRLAQTLKAQLIAEQELKNLEKQRSLLETKDGEIEDGYWKTIRDAEIKRKTAQDALTTAAIQATAWLDDIDKASVEGMRFASGESTTHEEKQGLENASRLLTLLATRLRQQVANGQLNASTFETLVPESDDRDFLASFLRKLTQQADMGHLLRADRYFDSLLTHKESPLRANVADQEGLLAKFTRWAAARGEYEIAEAEYLRAKKQASDAEELVFSKRMLIQFIDEQEEKSVELLEALRAHSSNVDNYLKRLAIALEDDVNAQFYEPAFQKIRRVSRTYDVQLGQIETTTVLTNNRSLAKVSPSATMEFDLPKREILITEAMNNMNALTQEYGNLLQEGTFLAGTSMLAGQPASGLIGSASPVQQIPGISTGEERQFGAALEALIPDPAIYKFETGTGFEIRPTIQPDGHSIVYNFDYMYTTNVREPVRADEKHLGRIKRHFVHTDVQTSSYELREVSRYTVALKASRTSRGVPGLEDVPIAGVLFRPAASDESSLQENIILASSVIYPTVYDLMGLRWSPYVDELSSSGLASEKAVQRARHDEIRRQLLSRTQAVVNRRLGIPNVRPLVPEQITPGPAYSPVEPEHISPGLPLPNTPPGSRYEGIRIPERISPRPGFVPMQPEGMLPGPSSQFAPSETGYGRTIPLEQAKQIPPFHATKPGRVQFNSSMRNGSLYKSQPLPPAMNTDTVGRVRLN